MGLSKYHILACEVYFLTGQLLRLKVSAIQTGPCCFVKTLMRCGLLGADWFIRLFEGLVSG